MDHNKKKFDGCRYGLSGRAPALQVQSPEFKLYPTKKKRKKKNV
jgi:hypothetical protein